MLAALMLMFCRITIVSVFAVSATGKALDIAAFRDAISDFRLLPPSWSKAIAWTFLVVEFAVVPLTAIGGSVLPVGFALATGLLVVFSAALAVALWRNAKIACNCFGHAERRISAYDVARNGLLILCSLIGIWALVGPLPSLSGAEIVLIGLMALCFVALVTNLTDVVETLRRPFTPAG